MAEPGGALRLVDTPAPVAIEALREELWLCIHLPRLSLEALAEHRLDGMTADISTSTPTSTAIVERRGHREVVTCCNASAEQAGVQPGMTSSTAVSVAPTLCLQRRDLELERETLEGLAHWCSGFTSRLHLQHDAVLLEIGGSLRLFGGLNTLLQNLLDGLEQLGHLSSVSIAPTLLAAEWLARGGLSRHVLSLERLPAALAAVPVSVMLAGWQRAEVVLDDLQRLGVRRLGELYRLPRADLARRFGPRLLSSLDRALGRQIDARAAWSVPERFERRLVLGHGSTEHQYLLNGVGLLLMELVGLLQARAAAVRTLEVTLIHQQPPSTRFTLELVRESRDLAHLQHLLAERLERVALPHPVEEIGLRVPVLIEAAPLQVDLYAPARPAEDALGTLVERLAARLGNDAIQRPVLVSDYRPEYQTRTVPFPSVDHGAMAATSDIVRPDILQRNIAPRGDGRLHDDETHQAYIRSLHGLRPVWLLRTPRRLTQIGGQPCLHGPLELLQGPERILAGWWQSRPCNRDYYRALASNGARYWVYRVDARDGGSDWYLHGIFS
ncbi:MAG: DNA polymerase Y family protein [Gammaproteobacteria bacterium]|nr:DNA polymerase Y family protein [Gammaproteobacteria bacterium]